MKTADLHKMSAYVGNLDALFGMKTYRLVEGKGTGLKAVDLRNGQGLEMTVLADKCMNIPWLFYKGMSVGFASKTGLVGPQYFTEDGAIGFLRQFDGGFLTTCGITYSGVPFEKDGRKHGLHGTIFNAPAEHFVQEIIDLDGQVALSLRGTMTEATAFGENMKLSRSMVLETEANRLHIRDTVTNWGFSREPVMNLYHMNFGYPMLDEGARVYSSATKVAPRDADAQAGLPTYNVMDAPTVGRPEECYFLYTENSADGYVMLHNEKRGVAALIRYRTDEIPFVCAWKNMMAGGYALGLEPVAGGTMDRAASEADGTLRYLEPGTSMHFGIDVELTEDPAVIAQYAK